MKQYKGKWNENAGTKFKDGCVSLFEGMLLISVAGAAFFLALFKAGMAYFKRKSK